MKKGLTELVFILDKSGSMSGLENDTIGGFNSMLTKQKAIDGECYVTTVFFDHNYELIHDRTDLKAISPITEKEYQVGGSTALLDAIGRTINKITNAQKHIAEDYRAEKVMFVIITDGEENSSREYTAANIRNLIERQKEKYAWEFVFLGANIDAVETAGRYGISSNRAIDYLADSEGTELNFRIMTEAVAAFRDSGTIDEESFEEIRKDVKRRGGRR
ncbi:MAG TPA: VWA domain-containing protein [Clostridiaceae bacterium]|nr:VWA domain-containing protein [Clostridiaceae bacterium]